MFDQHRLEQWRKLFRQDSALAADRVNEALSELEPYRKQLRPNDNDEYLPLYSAQGQILSAKAPRWLCHLVGLRHRCVHVLLTCRNVQNELLLLLQIRAFDKDDSGGHLDMTVGGHMTDSGTESNEQVVFQEMREELGIGQDSLISKLVCVGSYAHRSVKQAQQYCNSEWRDVYLAEIAPSALAKIHFADGEVCGLVQYPYALGDQLSQQATLPIASGLKHSIPYCLQHLKAHPPGCD